jgi:hypothetical protein
MTIEDRRVDLMKRCAVLLLTVFLCVCLASVNCFASDGADELKESAVERFLGDWIND